MSVHPSIGGGRSASEREPNSAVATSASVFDLGRARNKQGPLVRLADTYWFFFLLPWLFMVSNHGLPESMRPLNDERSAYHSAKEHGGGVTVKTSVAAALAKEDGMHMRLKPEDAGWTGEIQAQYDKLDSHSCEYLNTAPVVVFYRLRWFLFEGTLLLVLMARLTLGVHRDPLAVTSWSNSWMVFALVSHAALHEYFKYQIDYGDHTQNTHTHTHTHTRPRYVYQPGEPEFLPCGYATLVVVVIAPVIFWGYLRQAGAAGGFQSATVDGGRGVLARLS